MHFYVSNTFIASLTPGGVYKFSDICEDKVLEWYGFNYLFFIEVIAGCCCGRAVSVHQCQTTLHPSFSFLLIQNLHPAHEEKEREKQGSGKELVLGITHARRELRIALERLF